MISSKKSFLFFIALFVATTAAIPNAQASSTLYKTTINGNVVKVNFYPKLLELRLKINGNPKCKYDINQHVQFLACSAGYLGANYYDKIYDAIKSKI